MVKSLAFCPPPPFRAWRIRRGPCRSYDTLSPAFHLLVSSAIRFRMIDRVKRVHCLSTLFLSKNGIMTERGVGRYPYLHRQTMLFSHSMRYFFSFITLRVCLSFSSFLLLFWSDISLLLVWSGSLLNSDLNVVARAVRGDLSPLNTGCVFCWLSSTCRSLPFSLFIVPVLAHSMLFACSPVTVFWK